MSIQLQWNLDRTANSAYSITRGILLAANHDNVQPLAITACEKFGNTIAMCQETCSKVESLIVRTPQHVAIRFLRASVGFDAADSATQLSKSQAGVQFLGLAAALVTSMGPYEAGSKLYTMLTASATDKTLLPTIRQLKDLMVVLEPRLQRAGFMNSVVGWVAYLEPLQRVELQEDSPPKKMAMHFSDHFPDSAGVGNLVDSFRMLSRVGEADIEMIEIRTTDNIPWIVAFTKWCLGAPPSIYSAAGLPIIEQPESKVSLKLVETGVVSSMRISIIRTMKSPERLIESYPDKPLRGMVSIETFGRYWLYKMGFDHGSAAGAVVEAMPFALNQALRSLQTIQNRYDRPFDGKLQLRDWDFSPPEEHFPLDPELEALGLIAFPEEHLIARTACKYLGVSNIINLPALGKHDQLMDLPKMRLHDRDLEKMCKCQNCKRDSTNPDHTCDKSEFMENLALICADILVLSLLSSLGTPLLYLKSQRTKYLYFRDTVKDVLAVRHTKVFSISDILKHVQDIVGHEDVAEGWIMSSSRGQVIFPTIFETCQFGKRGYLALTCLEGHLRYKDETYSQVLPMADASKSFSVEGLTTGEGPFTMQVDLPRMLVDDTSLVWLANSNEDTLEVLYGLQNTKTGVVKGQCPMECVIETLATALFLEDCPHDQNAILEKPDKFCVYTSPLYPFPTDVGAVRMTGVVAVDGHDQMRMVALANADHVVLRKKACLSCCLDVCRRSNYSVLVL